jgi:hypothetical protein
MAAVVTDLEREHQVPARGQHPAELGEHAGPVLPRHMDDRVVPEQPADRRVREVQRGHGTHLEPQVGVEAAGQCDHLGRQIDSGHVEPKVGQVPGHAARAAAHVDDRLPAAPLGEQPQQRPVQRRVAEGRVPQDRLGVLEREDVVTGPGRVEEGVRHGRGR